MKFTNRETFEGWEEGTPLEGEGGERYIKVAQSSSHHTEGYVVRERDGALLHVSECGILTVNRKEIL